MGHFAHECRTGKGKKVADKKEGRCFNFDQIRHYKKQCKEPANDGKGKMFALEIATLRPTTEEKGKVVFESTLLIHGLSVRVLIDSAISHSFISHYLIDKLNLELSYLVTSLRVVNPIGGYATLMVRCEQLELELLGHTFACNLNVFDFVGFGITLGMDWLSKHNAKIFCHDRKISLRHPNCSYQITYSVENPSFKVSALLGVWK